jgi:hypothetical protein
MKPNDQVVRHHILKLPRKSRDDCCHFNVTTDILLSTLSLLQPSSYSTAFAVMRLQIHGSCFYLFSSMHLYFIYFPLYSMLIWCKTTSIIPIMNCNNWGLVICFLIITKWIFIYTNVTHCMIVWYISAYLHSRVIPVKEHVYYCMHTYFLDTGLRNGSSNAVAAGVQ